VIAGERALESHIHRSLAWIAAGRVPEEIVLDADRDEDLMVDLGLGRADVIGALLALESTFGTRIPDESLGSPQLRTIAALVSMLAPLLSDALADSRCCSAINWASFPKPTLMQVYTLRIRIAALLFSLEKGIRYEGWLTTLQRFTPASCAILTVPLPLELCAFVARVPSHVARVADFLGGRFTCLPRAMAVRFLLRERGLDATICIGLQALPYAGHAWTEYRQAVLDAAPDIGQLYRKVLQA
jgi:acyl carrier protein